MNTIFDFDYSFEKTNGKAKIINGENDSACFMCTFLS